MKFTLEIRVVHENAVPPSPPEKQYPPVPPKVNPILPAPVENFRRGSYL